MGKTKKTSGKVRKSHPYDKGALNRQKPPTKPVFKKQGQTEHKRRPRKNEPELPFDPTDRVLLVGEGDFSFSLSLSSSHGCTSLTATTFESRDGLLDKYPQAATHINELLSDGHKILYLIDATRLGQPHVAGAAILRKARFDTIIFNFPHVGGRSTDVNRQVRANQDLVVRFLEAARQLLTPRGQIVVTIFEGQPYELWGLRNLVRHVGLTVERSMCFEAKFYPGYKHARTLGNITGEGGWKGEERKARMYILQEQGRADTDMQTKAHNKININTDDGEED